MLGSLVASVFSVLLLHWFTYAINSLTLVLLFSTVLGNKTHVFSIQLFSCNNILHVLFIIIISSIIGLPPFIGFWTKLYIFIFIGKFGTYLLILMTVLIMTIALIFYMTILRYSLPVELQNIDAMYIQKKTIKILLINCIFSILGVPFLMDLYLVFYGFFI